MDMDANGLAIVIGAIAAAFATIAGLFFKYMNTREKTTREDRMEADKLAKEERNATALLNAEILEKLGAIMEKNTESNKQIAEATTRSADEAKQRNGHLAEIGENSQKMILESQKMFKTYATKNFKAIQNISKQHVKEQVVDKQRVGC